MNNKIYIIGHKTPDLDSAAAAIAYADFKNKVKKTNRYTPALAGEINRETKFVLEKFGFDKPEILEALAGRQVILVDHNEPSQSAPDIEKAKILEVLDHHKIGFHYPEPIKFKTYPWGATCSIIANMYFEKSLTPEKNLAGLMLSAILIDTVIAKSPTCTVVDKQVIEKLAQLAEAGNWYDWGLELFKVRASVKELSAKEIIKSDFKDFEIGGQKFGVGQVETVDLGEFAPRQAELFGELDNLRAQGGYHSVMLFMTDIIKEGSLFLVASEESAKFEQAFGVKLEQNAAYLPGVMSRKKQVIPKLEQAMK